MKVIEIIKLTKEDKVLSIVNNFFLFFNKEATCGKCNGKVFKDNHEITTRLNKNDFDFEFKCFTCHYDHIIGIKYKVIDDMLEMIKLNDLKKTHESLIL